MHGNGALGAVGRRRGEAAQRLVCAAGNGYLGADDVDRTVGAERGGRRLRPPATGGPRGSPRPRRRARQDRRRTTCCSPGGSWCSPPRRTPRSGPRPSPLRHWTDSRCQRFGPKWSPPSRMRSRAKSAPVGDAEDQVAEVGRPQSGVAAELVDLVRRGLDQHVAAVGGGLGDGRLHHGGVRRAHRVDADRRHRPCGWRSCWPTS